MLFARCRLTLPLIATLGILALIVACSDERPAAPPDSARTEPVAASQPQQQAQQTQTEQTAQTTQGGRPQAQDQDAAPAQTSEVEQSAEQAPPPAPDTEPPSGDLAPAPYDPDHAAATVRALSVDLGPRTSASDLELAAAEYLRDRFRDLGYEAELQDFEFAAAEILAPITIDDTIAATALRFERAATAPVEAPLVDVPFIGNPDDFAQVDVRGAIAVVDRGILTFSEKAANAVNAGAVALFIVNTLDEPFVGELTEDSPIPILAVSRSEGDIIRQQIGSTASIAGAGATLQSRNVFARRPGGTCRVVVGGHYDTVPNVPGANDNASGIGVALALAAAWRDAASAHHICWLGFGSEELGLHGSAAYVRQLQASGEIDDLTAMLNLDAIGDGNRPIALVGDTALVVLAQGLAEQIGLSVQPGGLPTFASSDHANFVRAGVPVLFPIARGAILHVPADNFDNFDPDLHRDIGLLAHAALACLLQRADSPIEPTLSCELPDP